MRTATLTAGGADTNGDEGGVWGTIGDDFGGENGVRKGRRKRIVRDEDASASVLMIWGDSSSSFSAPARGIGADLICAA